MAAPIVLLPKFLNTHTKGSFSVQDTEFNVYQFSVISIKRMYPVASECHYYLHPSPVLTLFFQLAQLAQWGKLDHRYVVGQLGL